jgi:hypothetical protein
LTAINAMVEGENLTITNPVAVPLSGCPDATKVPLKSVEPLPASHKEPRHQNCLHRGSSAVLIMGQDAAEKQKALVSRAS